MRDDAECEVEVQRVEIEFRRQRRTGKQRFYFRRESKRAFPFGKVQRLYAEPIAHNKETALLLVPNCKRKHAVEPLQTFIVPLRVCAQWDFGVGIRVKDMPERFQFTPNLSEVVNLAVVGDPPTTIDTRHWHMSARR